jgi:hypothetical protein
MVKNTSCNHAKGGMYMSNSMVKEGRCLRYQNGNDDVLLCIVANNALKDGQAVDAVYYDRNNDLTGYKTIYPYDKGFLAKCEPVEDPMTDSMFRSLIPDPAFING